MSGGAKLAMRAFKLLAKAGGTIVWTTLVWELVTPNWEDVSDPWEG